MTCQKYWPLFDISVGEELSNQVIQKLALNIDVPRIQKDDVYDSLCYCVTQILTKHEILFNGMVNRVDVNEYIVFSSIANELFEVSDALWISGFCRKLENIVLFLIGKRK